MQRKESTYRLATVLVLVEGITRALYLIGQERIPYHHTIQDILRKAYFISEEAARMFAATTRGRIST